MLTRMRGRGKTIPIFVALRVTRLDDESSVPRVSSAACRRQIALFRADECKRTERIGKRMWSNFWKDFESENRWRFPDVAPWQVQKSFGHPAVDHWETP
jgi:hypothetical protein